ncbi:MAG: aspartate kinase [Deltaproteobacteria bacterium]|nr:MAG: aspartate kinase [Deltaproteobacteria bacterium]
MSKFIVLKFGSSVLPTEEALQDAVQEIYRHLREGLRVVAVVSAIGTTTDSLVQRSRGWCDGEPPPDAWATVLGTGEALSAGLLGLALSRSGVPCEVFDAARCDLRTTEGIDAEPLGIDTSAFLSAEADVIVVPGFVGRDHRGRPTLLGRGGSDLTAAFLAHSLGARCRLLKDVDGLYEADPNVHPDARRLARASFEEAIRIGGAVVQPKTVHFARDRRLTLEIAALGEAECTLIGPHAVRAAPLVDAEPVRIGLLGCGTVGGGVLERLLLHPERFEVTGVAVREPGRHDQPVPLATDCLAVVDGPCEVVVELIGGVEPAASLIQRALDRGKIVVTANKAVLAAHPELLGHPRLLASASVGGALPVLEAVGRLTDLVRVEGVLNGTSNDVLCSIEQGRDLAEAVSLAQDRGFAEADPSADLDGRDAAHKLAVIARLAFGKELVADWVPREHVADAPSGCRQVAWVDAEGHCGVENRPVDGVLGRCRGAENAVILHRKRGGTVVLRGLGAGRWPTAVAVLADLFSLVGRRESAKEVA